MKAFLSGSFDENDEPLINWFKKLLRLLNVDPVFADWPEPRPPIEKVRSAIAECDFLVAVMNKKEKIAGKELWKTSDWIQNEIGIAHGLKKPIVPFVEKKVDTSGVLKYITEYVGFERKKLDSEILKIIEAINRATRPPFSVPEHQPLLTRPLSRPTPYVDRFVAYLLKVRNDLGDTEVFVHMLTEPIDHSLSRRPHYITNNERALKFDDLRLQTNSLDVHHVKIENPVDTEDHHQKKFEIAFHPVVMPGELASYSLTWFWRRIYPIEPNHFHFTSYSPTQTLFLMVELEQDIVNVEITQNTVKFGDCEIPSENPSKKKIGNKWKIYWTVSNPPINSVSTLGWLPKK